LYSHPTFARLIIIASLGDFIDLPQFVSALVLNFMLDCSHCSLFSLMAPMFNPLGLLFSSPCIMESFFCLHPVLHASVTARPTTQTSAHRNFRRPARLMTSQFILTCYTHQHESTLCIGLPMILMPSRHSAHPQVPRLCTAQLFAMLPLTSRLTVLELELL
jgi:hypothetical protein